MSNNLVIAVTNLKGGVGKTMTTMFMAQEFVNRGYTVYVLDADPQQSALSWARTTNLPFTVVSVTEKDLTDHTMNTIEGKNVIIIDCPPGHQDILRAVYSMSLDALVIPTGIDAIDLTEAFKLKQFFADDLPVAVVFTRVNARRSDWKQLAEADIFDSPRAAKKYSFMVRQSNEKYSSRYGKTINHTHEYKTVVSHLISLIRDWQKGQ